MDDELLGMLRYLRLSNLAARWDEHLDLALREAFSPVRLLRHVVEEEWRAKRDHARERRLRQARIPELFRIETYPFDKQPKAPKKRLLAVYDAFDFVEKRQNLIWLGPTGCGKTGLATSFLVEAIERGYTGRYVLFGDLLRELFQSVADHSEEKVLKQYAAYDCLQVDLCGEGRYVERGFPGPGLLDLRSR